MFGGAVSAWVERLGGPGELGGFSPGQRAAYQVDGDVKELGGGFCSASPPPT